MCTVIAATGISRAWPLLLAANRDEMLARPWLPPAYHWPDQPDVLGGQDTLTGGTWLALNRAGVIAAVLNRAGSLGPAPGKRSRGDLPLLALRHATAAAGAHAIAALDAALWRGFNLLIADRTQAIFLRGVGEGRITPHTLAPGLHMITTHDPDDASSPRIARHLPRFRDAPLPSPPDWSTWPKLLSNSAPPREASLHVAEQDGFGTVNSTLLALGDTPVFRMNGAQDSTFVDYAAEAFETFHQK